VRLPAPYGDEKWKLYNLKDDPSESQDISTNQPKIMKEMLTRWNDFVADTGIVVSAVDARIPDECVLQ
jgi:arylsulfatase